MGKTEEFDIILDRCINRINSGESIEACLADYPQYAREMEPLLMVAARSQQAYAFTPSAGAKSAARTRFTTAMANLRRQTERRTHPVTSVRRWSLVWAAAAAVAVIAIAAYLYTAGPLSPGLGPTAGPTYVSPGQTSTPTSTAAPTTSTQTPAPTGYMVLLLSDEVNDIGDFDWLKVTITKVGLQQGGDSPWMEYDVNPAATVDLVQLQGLNATVVWTAALPVGTYNKAFIYVDSVEGALKSVPPTTTTTTTATPVTVKLPGGKLQMSKTFEITAGSVTNFVYDITVIEAGQSGKYILNPQVAQSGADQEFNEVDREGKPVQSGGQGQGKRDQPGKPDQPGNSGQPGSSDQTGSLSLTIVPANPMPGDSVTLTVTFQGQPEPGVEVTVNGQGLPGRTGQDGKITFTVPLEATSLSITARKGQLESDSQGLQFDLAHH